MQVLTGQGTEDERAFVLGLCADLELPPVVAEAAGNAKTSTAAFPVSLGPEKAYADEADAANADSAKGSQADTATDSDADITFSDKPELTSDDPEWSRLEDFQPDPDTPIDENCIELPTDDELAAANQGAENDIPFVQGDIDTILKGVVPTSRSTRPSPTPRTHFYLRFSARTTASSAPLARSVRASTTSSGKSKPCTRRFRKLSSAR